MHPHYYAPRDAPFATRADDSTIRALLAWIGGRKFVKQLGYSLQELTGDSAPDARALASADILATTPEKWDGVSRHWQQRDYVRKVGLVIIDEIHLLGEDRGPILEVIVSRMRYIATKTDQTVRVVGLSTAMANAHDLAEWLGIPPDGESHMDGAWSRPRAACVSCCPPLAVACFSLLPTLLPTLLPNAAAHVTVSCRC